MNIYLFIYLYKCSSQSRVLFGFQQHTTFGITRNVGSWLFNPFPHILFFSFLFPPLTILCPSYALPAGNESNE